MMNAAINRRADDLRLLVAALLFLAALAPVLADAFSADSLSQTPPPLKAAYVGYRPDGGQMVQAGAALQPNILTALNCGRRIDLAAANIHHLGRLPGLGGKSAAAAKEKACLNMRQRKNLDGLVTETCDRNRN